MEIENTEQDSSLGNRLQSASNPRSVLFIAVICSVLASLLAVIVTQSFWRQQEPTARPQFGKLHDTQVLYMEKYNKEVMNYNAAKYFYVYAWSGSDKIQEVEAKQLTYRQKESELRRTLITANTFFGKDVNSKLIKVGTYMEEGKWSSKLNDPVFLKKISDLHKSNKTGVVNMILDVTQPEEFQTLTDDLSSAMALEIKRGLQNTE